MTEFGSDYFFLAEPHTGSGAHLSENIVPGGKSDLGLKTNDTLPTRVEVMHN
jgi:hypothetical protein